MEKLREVTQFNSCWNKAKNDEIVFILLGRDKATPATIRFWVDERIAFGLNHPEDPQIKEAIACARRIEEKQKENSIL